MPLSHKRDAERKRRERAGRGEEIATGRKAKGKSQGPDNRRRPLYDIPEEERAAEVERANKEVAMMASVAVRRLALVGSMGYFNKRGYTLSPAPDWGWYVADMETGEIQDHRVDRDALWEEDRRRTLPPEKQRQFAEEQRRRTHEAATPGPDVLWAEDRRLTQAEENRHGS